LIRRIGETLWLRWESVLLMRDRTTRMTWKCLKDCSRSRTRRYVEFCRYGERNRLIRYGARRWGSDLLDDFNVYIINFTK
jgi:hypothetical protein